MSPRNAGKSARVPFKDDLTYLTSEFAWIKARSARIGAQRDGGSAPVLARPRRRVGQTEPVAECECRLTSLRTTEDSLRQEIDARLALNRDGGPELGLDRLCREHGLLDFERLVLLVGTLPVVGNLMAASYLEGASVLGVSGTIDLETVWSFLEMDSDARIRSLVCFLPASALLREGLVYFGYKPATPGDLARSGVEVSGKTLAVLTGIPEFSSLSRQFESAGEDD